MRQSDLVLTNYIEGLKKAASRQRKINHPQRNPQQLKTQQHPVLA
jgi:hypothetical protein